MSLPEERFDRLIAQLRAMSRIDRNAILARLDRAERQRIRAKLLRHDYVRAAPTSPYSPDIAARLAAADKTLTKAGRKALADFLLPAGGQDISTQERAGSLTQAMGGLLRSWGKQP